MNDSLYNDVLDRLLDANGLDALTTDLVEAACHGREALAQRIASGGTVGPPAQKRATRPTQVRVGAFLTRLAVEGFRGIGAKAVLDIAPGPGLTLVMGRNGSGKSSFAEALETLVTGKCSRWEGRPAWKEGWRNLHMSERPPRIEATFAVEGSPPVVVTRTWHATVGFDEHQLEVARRDERLADLAPLGWKDVTGAFRPFLSYSDLGALMEEPSRLHDQLKSILGLEEISEAVRRLADERKALRDQARTADSDVKTLREVLDRLDDPRAKACAAALRARTWKLDEIEKVVLGTGSGDQPALAALRSLSQLSAPELDEVITSCGELRAALESRSALVGTSAKQSEELVHVLEVALGYQAVHDGDCPVCGSVLPADWRGNAETRLSEAREISRRLSEAGAKVEAARKRVQAHLLSVPPVLRESASLGLPVAALEAWTRWANAPADISVLEHAEDNVLPLVEAVGALRAAASERLQSLDQAWAEPARRLAAWLSRARVVQQNDSTVRALENAEKWLTSTEHDMRDARFGPIATRAQQIWRTLRQQSNVDLVNVELEGKGTRRYVRLNVTVDGTDSVALSVMSQGELNALSLSLFLPRMSLDESPFRFVVVDDPVQAMDPQKVDGLARALWEVARSRQVLVFTHDARLSEAVGRLQIPATVLEVSRRPGSIVAVTKARDAIDQYLEDARAVAFEEEKVGPSMSRVVVATFCRSALEAACMLVVRRRRLARGARHEDVEATIANARGAQLYALALLDDDGRGGEVLRAIRNQFDDEAVATYGACKEGAHSAHQGPLKELVRSAEKMARAIAGLP
jgi:recombinational DNA repair ATPase RecF